MLEMPDVNKNNFACSLGMYSCLPILGQIFRTHVEVDWFNNT